MPNPVNFMIVVAIFVAFIAILAEIIVFIYRFGKYGYIGNVLTYILPALGLCLFMSLVLCFSPVHLETSKEITHTFIVDGVTKEITFTQTFTESNIPFDNGWEKFLGAVYNSFRMLAVGYDKSMVAPYYDEIWSFNWWFGVMYAATSVFAFASTSISVILFFAKSGFAKVRNFWKSLFKDSEVYYIFSDSKVANATKKLGEVLMAKNHIVVMYITKASLKTQEGTEYRDMLINAGFDVKSEGFSEKLCGYLFKKFFNRNYHKRWFLWKHYRHRKVTVYGLFPDDESSVELATNFRNGILKNQCFQEHFGPYLKLKNVGFEGDRVYTKSQKEMRDDYEVIKNFRVFITYQDYDIDLVNGFSGQTLHIVNTLSQYDMVSSEFILNNPLSSLIDVNAEKDFSSLNVSFFGFGNINKPIYEKMTYSYQMSGDNKNKINYHIYDYNADEIVEKLMNEYVIPNKKQKAKANNDYLEKPLLYGLDVGLSGRDLTSYEVLKNHFQEIKKQGKRFKEDGLEVFVVSAARTSQDIKIAFNLRDVLLRTFEESELKKTRIYVRIGDELIANNLVNANKDIVFKQKDLAHSKKEDVPIIIFGEDTNMAHFIKQDYDRLLANGKAAYASYYKGILGDKWNPEREQMSWLLTDKLEVMTNTATAYSLKTKLALFGYHMNKAGLFVDKDNTPIKSDEIKKIINITNEQYLAAEFDTAPMRLATLEHNRWTTTVYNIYRYDQLPLSAFKKRNETSTNIKTKSISDKSHICMTTNAGLKELYKKIVKDNPSREKDAFKLVYSNDVVTLNEILDRVENSYSSNILVFDHKILLSKESKEENANVYLDDKKFDILVDIVNEADAELITMDPSSIDTAIQEELKGKLSKEGLEIRATLSKDLTLDQFKQGFIKNNSNAIHRCLFIDFSDNKNDKVNLHLELNVKKGLTVSKGRKAIKLLTREPKAKKNDKKK